MITDPETPMPSTGPACPNDKRDFRAPTFGDISASDNKTLELSGQKTPVFEVNV
tara:strand:- start:222 stop:383 length:162 start_codon:yes stop_codon:yes gene_type:complete